MLRRQTQIPDQAKEALQEHWRVEVVAEQAGIQLEVDLVVGESLALVALSGTPDVLETCQYKCTNLLRLLNVDPALCAQPTRYSCGRIPLGVVYISSRTKRSLDRRRIHLLSSE